MAPLASQPPAWRMPRKRPPPAAIWAFEHLVDRRAQGKIGAPDDPFARAHRAVAPAVGHGRDAGGRTRFRRRPSALQGRRRGRTRRIRRIPCSRPCVRRRRRLVRYRPAGPPADSGWSGNATDDDAGRRSADPPREFPLARRALAMGWTSATLSGGLFEVQVQLPQAQHDPWLVLEGVALAIFDGLDPVHERRPGDGLLLA